MYAERFMGSPNTTSDYHGYVESELFRKIADMRDKMFYLVHGTADEIVHFQQSMLLAYELTKSGIPFQQQVRKMIIFFVILRSPHRLSCKNENIGFSA